MATLTETAVLLSLTETIDHAQQDPPVWNPAALIKSVFKQWQTVAGALDRMLSKMQTNVQ